MRTDYDEEFYEADEVEDPVPVKIGWIIFGSILAGISPFILLVYILLPDNVEREEDYSSIVLEAFILVLFASCVSFYFAYLNRLRDYYWSR